MLKRENYTKTRYAHGSIDIVVCIQTGRLQSAVGFIPCSEKMIESSEMAAEGFCSIHCAFPQHGVVQGRFLNMV